MTEATIVTTNDQNRITPSGGTPRRFTRPYCDYRGVMTGAVAAAISRDARQGVNSPGPFTRGTVDEDRDVLQQFEVSLSNDYPFFRTGGMFESRAGVMSLKRERERQLERERAARRAAFEARVERESGDDVETSDDSEDSPGFTAVTVTPVNGDEDDARQVMIPSRDTDVPVDPVDESVDEEPVEGDPEYSHCGPGKFNIESCECCVCPACSAKSIYKRETKEPAYRCRNPECNHEFEHPSRRGD